MASIDIFERVRQRFQVGVLSGLNRMESFLLNCRTGRFSQTLTDIMMQSSRMVLKTSLGLLSLNPGDPIGFAVDHRRRYLKG